MDVFSKKKILVLGGAYQHRKIVESAKNLGIETYVTDYLPFEKSPAKQMADHGYMFNITELPALEKLCKDEKINGVIAPYLDVTQRPYFELCERLGYPCFGNRYQHHILTDKRAFKEFCNNNDADIIPTYSEQQLLNDNGVQYPLLIKPTDSRGSRGIYVCRTQSEAIENIEKARAESFSGQVIIEKYMTDCDDLQLVYMVIDGEPVCLKVEDRYLGKKNHGLDKLAIATVFPSSHTREFFELADEKIKKAIRALKLKNAPVFIQAFWDHGVVRLYDPGLRLPGDDFDVALKYSTGIDMPLEMIRFALTGRFSEGLKDQLTQNHRGNGTVIAMLLPCLKEGIISDISGLREISANPAVVSCVKSYHVGDMVVGTSNVKQRFGEFVLSCKTTTELKQVINWLYNTLHVRDNNGNEMLIEQLDVCRLR